MTSKSVTNVAGIMDGFNRTGVNGVGNTSSLTDSFSSVMQKATSVGQSFGDMTMQLKESPKTSAPEPTLKKEASKVAQKLEEKNNAVGADQGKEALDDAKTAVEKAAKETVKEVADTLGLSEEEVEAAMETLGLTAVALLDKANLMQLMMNLSGETDMLALTTNEALYADVMEAVGSAADKLAAVQDTFGLSDRQLQDCMEQLALQQEEQTVLQQEEQIPNGMQEEITPVVNLEDAVEGEMEASKERPEKAVITITKNGEEVRAVVETDVKTGAETVTQESGPLTEHSTENGMAQGEGTDRQNDHNSKDTQQSANLVLQNIAQNQNTAQVQTGTELPPADTQAQDIMEQIMDYMKIQIKPDTTSLEMQLHPESLGTLNIHIAAKDGILTAQFTAQSEAVKNAIEGQLVTLQQNLNDQGIKVEAVEVNVAAQQFNRNMEQGQSGSGSPSEEAKKKNVRRINLKELEAFEEEELEEADQITVDMMAINGNSVDYLA